MSYTLHSTYELSLSVHIVLRFLWISCTRIFIQKIRSRPKISQSNYPATIEIQKISHGPKIITPYDKCLSALWPQRNLSERLRFPNSPNNVCLRYFLRYSKSQTSRCALRQICTHIKLRALLYLCARRVVWPVGWVYILFVLKIIK